MRTDLCEQKLRRRLREENARDITESVNRFKLLHTARKRRDSARPAQKTNPGDSLPSYSSDRTGGRNGSTTRAPSLIKKCGGRRRVGGGDPGAGQSQRLAASATRNNNDKCLFPRRYTRGELPCGIIHLAGGLALSWTCPLKDLDYHLYLPMFMDGVKCVNNPCQFIARQGVHELIQGGRGMVIRDVLHKLIKPMRSAILTNDPDTVLAVIKILKSMVVRHPKCLGPALVPYYRQLITPVLNLYVSRGGRSTFDAMDYSQYRKADLSVEILEMLELLERHGGPDAYIQIKVMVPTYESVL